MLDVELLPRDPVEVDVDADNLMVVNLGTGQFVPGAACTWNDIVEKPFSGIDHNTLKVENDVLMVNTTDDAEEDNTRPITSSGVNVIVGNIDILLQHI